MARISTFLITPVTPADFRGQQAKRHSDTDNPQYNGVFFGDPFIFCPYLFDDTEYQITFMYFKDLLCTIWRGLWFVWPETNYFSSSWGCISQLFNQADDGSRN